MYPTAMTISHRGSTGSWTFVQSGSLSSTNGWSEMIDQSSNRWRTQD